MLNRPTDSSGELEDGHMSVELDPRNNPVVRNLIYQETAEKDRIIQRLAVKEDRMMAVIEDLQN